MPNTTNANSDLGEFILRPDTVSFIIRGTNTGYLEEQQYIRRGTSLAGDYAVAYVQRDRVSTILRDFGTYNISLFSSVMGLLGQQDLEASGITAIQQQPYLNLNGQGVLVAFIDTGIDYTNDSFLYEDGTTKIKYIWDQTQQGNPPEEFYFGAEYTEEQINEALNSDDPYSVVPHRDEVGHGTFLASLAAGREEGEYMGAAPASDIIVVKLKPANDYYRNWFLIPEEQQNAFESADLALGVEYLRRKALELRRPIAICISTGTNYGGHDGESIFEEYLMRLSHIPGISLCSAAGNESSARHHVQGRVVENGDVFPIEIRVGDTRDSIFINMWNNASERFSVSVKSPTGEIVNNSPAKTGSKVERELVLEKSIVSIEYYFPIDSSAAQLSIIKIIAPTPGIWTMNVTGEVVLEGVFHAWLPITGFISPLIEFLSPTPNYTITIPGTAIGSLSCGAYNSANNSLYVDSSWGPTRLPMLSPDFVAPGVEVRGVFPTGYGTMSGTSVASAITTGASALLLQWGIVQQNDLSMNTYLIWANIIRGCERDPGIIYPNDQLGYGRLNLQNTFNLLRGL